MPTRYAKKKKTEREREIPDRKQSKSLDMFCSQTEDIDI
jgi:hypothetical protein